MDAIGDFFQQNYRILVATEPENLIIGKADLWDSGEQATGKPHPRALFTHCFFSLFQPIASKNGPIDAGVVGTKAILNVLMDFRQPDVLFEMANKRTFPGWGYGVDALHANTILYSADLPGGSYQVMQDAEQCQTRIMQ